MTRIKTLTVIHQNSYTADIKGININSFHSDDNIVRISIDKDYQYEDRGFARWDSIEPLDKDEITSLQITFRNGETKNISVPFKDISSNGAYCINEKSESYEDKNSIIVKWIK